MNVLHQFLLNLKATGLEGFEGLIKKLVEKLTGYQLFLARSGDQSGRDMRSGRSKKSIIAIECKRYGQKTELDETALIGEITEATNDIPDLDSWILVTSKAITDQLYSSLERTAQKFRLGLSIICLGDNVPSSLEALCANGAEICRDFFSGINSENLEACADELRAVREMESYSLVLDRLRMELSRSAAYEWWRENGHQWLMQKFASASESRVAFGQVIDVQAQAKSGRLVPRTGAMSTLEEWYRNWSSERKFFVLLGDEGDGKTWAVASWVANKLKSETAIPPVLWLASRDVANQNPKEFIPENMAKWFGDTVWYWTGRFENWLSRRPEDAPTFVLILDGINERNTDSWWRVILENLSGSPWFGHTAVVVISRSAYWETFHKLRSIPAVEWTIQPYDDQEFRLALQLSGIVEKDLPKEVLPLARKPRYFDLTMQHREKLSAAGDVTVARLIYEDWKDRWQRKSNIEVNDERFQEILKDLARISINKPGPISTRELERIVPRDLRSTLNEVITGGILVSVNGQLRVEPNRLKLALGLLLADQIETEEKSQGPERLDEVAAIWLEAHPDNEIKTGICECASLHAFHTKTSSLAVRATLLKAWLFCLNQDESVLDSVIAYFPIDPEAYFSLAEIIWQYDNDNPWAQRLLMKIFLKYSDNETYQDRFVTIFERWLGFVHILGSPVAVTPEKRVKRQEKIADLLGRTLAVGAFNYAGFRFNAIDDDGLIRLGRVALCVISHLPRGPFIRGLFIGCLAEELNGFAEKNDLFCWVIRSSPVDLGAVTRDSAEYLISTNQIPPMRAAYYLLTFEGSPESIKKRSVIPDDIFAKNKLIKEVRKDPCKYIFAWKREDCAKCSDREDVNVFHLAQQLSHFCWEEDFEVPPAALQRIIAEVNRLDISKVHIGLSYTQLDWQLEQIEPVLCSAAATVAAGIYRSLAREIVNRDGYDLTILTYFLSEHSLLFGEMERRALLTRWQGLRESSDEPQARHSEAKLVDLLLRLSDGVGQLDILLRRTAPLNEILISFEYWTASVSTDVLLITLNRVADDLDRLRQLLYFIASMPGELSGELVESILPFLEHSDSAVRATILEIVFRSRNVAAIASVINGSWHWQLEAIPNETHFGSLLLAEYGQTLNYDELRTRIAPEFLGRAVESRGLSHDEVLRLSNDIDRVWQQVINNTPLPPEDFPKAEIQTEELSPLDNIERIGLARRTFSQTVKFIARQSIWGGVHNGKSELGFNPNGISDERVEKLQEILGETLHEQRAAENHWFGRRFAADALRPICINHPELVKSWLKPVLDNNDSRHRTSLLLARSFYEALCIVLLEIDADTGIELWNALRTDNPLTETKIGFGLLDPIEIAIFSVPESNNINKTRALLLDGALSDRDLLRIALLSHYGDTLMWLRTVIDTDLDSHSPFHIARALTLCGFVDAEWAGDHLRDFSTLGKDTLYAQLAINSLQRRRKDSAAKHWFDQLMSDSNSEKAWAGFRLLLRVVDSRIGTWHVDSETHAIDSRRIAFFDANRDIVQKAIEKNEEGLRKHFLGEQILEGQAWPWMKD